MSESSPDAPTGVILVETIDSQDVVTPEPHIAADDAALFGIAADQRDGPADALDGAGDFPDQHPLPDRSPARLKFLREPFADEATPALDPKTLFGQRGMVGNKFRMGDTISIGKDQIIPAGHENGLIQDDCFAEAVIFLPDMFYRKRL